MRLLLILLTLSQTICPGASFGADAPPADFLSKEVHVPPPAGTASVPPSIGRSVGDFVSAMVVPGLWEAAKEGNWIYRMTSTDQLSGHPTTLSLQFMYHPSVTGAYLGRAESDGQELSAEEIFILATSAK